MKYGYLKVASAVPKIEIADCHYNTSQIENFMAKAEGLGAEIIVFPELCVTGYSCQDLFQQQLLLEKAEASLLRLMEFSRNLKIVTIIGAPLSHKGRLFNLAAVLQHGKLHGFVPKTYLPNYKEFYEQRWFSSGAVIREGETLKFCIDKICAYSGANEIRKTDIDAVTEPVLDAVVFQMTDMLSAGRFDQALVKLQQLLKMQQEPLAILGAVGNHFRRVSAARTLLDNGKNASDLQRLCGIPDYPARKTMEAARRFTPEFCRRAAELVLETDYKIKTSYDDPERLLELLLLQLAQEGRNG